MTGKLKLIVLTCTASIFMLCGCTPGTTAGTSTAKKPADTSAKLARVSSEETRKLDKAVATEQEKTQLLKQLEGKFEDPEAHFKLGKLYEGDGMWSKAENEFSTALSFDPVHREAQAARIKVLLESGEKGKATLLADDYIKQTGNSAAGSLRLGTAFQKELLDDYALVCYKQALNLAPNSAKVNRQIGYYYLSKNNLDLAKEYLSRSFQLDSMQADVAGELGRLGVPVQVRKPEPNVKKADETADKADRQVKP